MTKPEQTETTSAKRPARPRISRGRRSANEAEVNALRDFLATMDTVTKPTLHINGLAYPHAVLTVDFGQPKISQKLTQDQASELVTRMRKLTKEMLGHESNVRVSNDSHHGVWWTAIN